MGLAYELGKAVGRKPRAAAFIALLAGIAVWLAVESSPATPRATISAPTPTAPAKAKPTTADLELQQAVVAGKLLKRSMKDPSSFRVDEFVIYPGGNACYVYAARNSFNANLQGRAVFDGSRLWVQEQDKAAFTKAWNQICTRGNGTHLASGLNSLNAWD